MQNNALLKGVVCDKNILERICVFMMNEEELGFNTEFKNDRDVEEMISSLVTTVANDRVIMNDEDCVLNKYKIQQMVYTFKMLKYLTKGMNAKVAYALHDPYKSMGYVSVTGDRLVFRRAEWFMKAVELASNFDVYTKKDGSVQMDFTFHGLVRASE